MSIPFRRDMRFEYAVLEEVSPLVRRIIARNPGPFTFHGTGTYVVGRGKVAVIDAGPDDRAHVEALLAALAGEEITHQLVTHTHLDHSPAARVVRDATGARIWAYGPHGAGRLQHGEAVEAGADLAFAPDVRVGHGSVIEGDGWTIECVYTPGHCSNHLCFALREERTLFTGDHVMGWSTAVIAPPDGDMAAYFASLELLLTRHDAVYRPTHGAAIEDPAPFVRATIEHRRARERQIVDSLARGLDTIAAMVPAMYTEVAPILHPAAARSVLAHLVDMAARGIVRADGDVSLHARYRLR